MNTSPLFSLKASRIFGRGHVIYGFFLAVFVFSSFLPFEGACSGLEQLSVSGITRPKRDLILGLTIPGVISKVFLKEGAHVKKGQVILQLDDRMEVLEVKRRKLIWESKAELESAKDKVKTLGPQVESTRALYNSTKSVSREDLEKKELDYELAVEEVKRLETEKAREKIEYEMALQNLREKRLVSPVQGTIIRIFLHEGECYQAEKPLVRVVDTSRCLLVCNVDEPLGRTFKRGKAVKIKVRAGKGFVFKQGIMSFVSPVADPASGLLEVKIEFDNKDGDVRPGVEGFLLLNSLRRESGGARANENAR